MASQGGTTVAAIASPPGSGRRGIVRLSGPRTRALLEATCRMESGRPALQERGFFLARFDDGRGEQPALVLWMPGPRSFTREDVGELHLPGSPFLLSAALDRLLELGAEPAPPGEFTRRAFLNGRIDLLRAEGVLALVSARHRDERRAASALLHGGLSERMSALRDALEGWRALCEASLDFDESDTGHVDDAELAAGVRAVRTGIAEALAWEERRVPASAAARIVLAGDPNAGKSRLFNRLAGEKALVSDLAGTTRDALVGDWVLEGALCRLYDTAGIEDRGGDTGPDGLAQEHGRRIRAAADLLLWVVDASDPGAGPPPEIPTLLVWNKMDLVDRSAPPDGLGSAVPVSAATGEGIDALESAVARRLGLHGESGAEGEERAASALGRELSARHRHALEAAAQALDRALHDRSQGLSLDLFAEALRGATAELDRITGRTTPEDLLDRIFAAFCIGK